MKDSRKHSKVITRERLIEAAGAVFGEMGLHGATIRHITERAGANIASVNYHFRDKFELYLTVVRSIQESLDAAVNLPLSGGTPESRLRQRLSSMLMVFHDTNRPAWHGQLVVRELIEPTPALEISQAGIQRHFDPIAQIVRELRPDLSESQAMLTTCGIVAQVIFHNHHEHLRRNMFPTIPTPTLDEIINHVVEFSLAALRGLPPGGSQTGNSRREQDADKSASRPRKVRIRRTTGTRA